MNNKKILNMINGLKEVVETSDSEVAGLVLGISFKDDRGNVNICGNTLTLYGLVEELKQEVDKRRDDIDFTDYSVDLQKLIEDLKNVQAEKLSDRFD